MPRDSYGPFQPGAGGMPPYLAGRETEQKLAVALLERLKDGRRLPSDLVLFGPRGNGKTVLLNWLRDEARTIGVETVVVLPSEVQDSRRLAELLLPEPWWEALTPEAVSVLGISWRPGRRQAAPPIRTVLAARARSAPLLAVIDEAHTLSPAVGQELLNASQVLRWEHPFLLVLAGTPNLQRHLARMNASFWDRNRILRIGRLDEAATAEAFRRPLQAEGLDIEPEALDQLVRWSHGYPFFIQVLGEAAWNVAVQPDAPGRIRIEDCVEAYTEFVRRRDEYYLRRFAELEDAHLVPAARSVAEGFGAAPRLSTGALQQRIASALPAPAMEDVAKARDTLSDLGFIWRTARVPGWEAGIPSLMDYVLEFAPDDSPQ